MKLNKWFNKIICFFSKHTKDWDFWIDDEGDDQACEVCTRCGAVWPGVTLNHWYKPYSIGDIPKNCSAKFIKSGMEEFVEIVVQDSKIYNVSRKSKMTKGISPEFDFEDEEQMILITLVRSNLSA